MNDLPRSLDLPAAAWVAMLAGVFLVAGCTQPGNAAPTDAAQPANAVSANDPVSVESGAARTGTDTDAAMQAPESTKAEAADLNPHAVASATPRQRAQSATAQAATTATSVPLVVPMRAFARALILGARGAGYQMPTQLALPAIWLFAPDGKLVAQVTSEAELQALSKPWPASESSQIPYPVLVEAWRSAGGNTLPEATPGQGIAILMDQHGSTCHTPKCQALQKGLRDLQQAPWGAMTYTAHWRDEEK